MRLGKLVRVGFIAGLAIAGVSYAAAPGSSAEITPKVFRYSFPIAETGFDPAQISDLYSRIITANIFDALYDYDYLARPMKIRPVLATAMPEVTNDYKTWTIQLRKGIFFADDAAFGGKRRELTADDVVYSYKRHYDPKNKSQNVYRLENEQILGLPELKAEADKKGRQLERR